MRRLSYIVVTDCLAETETSIFLDVESIWILAQLSDFLVDQVVRCHQNTSCTSEPSEIFAYLLSSSLRRWIRQSPVYRFEKRHFQVLLF